MLPIVGSHSATIAVLNASIETLAATKDKLKITPVKVVFWSVIGFLNLARDEMTDDDAFVELAKYYVRACHALKTVTKGMDVDSLSGPVEKAIKSLEKTIHDIESKVGERMLGANNLRERHPRYAEACPALWKMETQKISEILNCLELYDALVAGGNEQCVQRPVDTKPSTSVLLVTTQSSTYSPLAPAEPPLVPDTGERALRCLISGAIPQGERTSLIESVLSSGKTTDMVTRLRENDAQSFVDVISDALENLDLAPQIRRECLRLLYKTCAGHALLPRSLQIELPDSITGVALYSGGFGDVWNREYQGQQVAIKVLRTYVHSDLRKIIRRFCKEFVTWKSLRHPNILPLLGVAMSETQFAMVSEWMPNGNINHFVKSHLDVNRFELLGDAARGLIYMHEQGMIHGDLKGTNILIDETGHARLADFGLLTIISDTTKPPSSTPSTQGGTYRWMSPELSFPEEFGLDKSRPTKSSDCWALGMVVYEVLSGRVPFYHYKGHDVALALRVLKGERPERPQGAGGMWFTDDVWRISERCWARKRDDRPRIEDVLQVLEKASSSWATSSPWMVEDSSSIDPPAQNSSRPNSEGSTEESDVSSLSHVAPSQPLLTFSPKAPLYEITNNQDLGAYVNNPSESDSNGSVVVLDRAPPVSGFSRGDSHLFRRWITRSNQEGLSEPNLTSSGRLSVGRPSIIHNEGEFDVEAWESHSPAYGGIIEKENSGDVVAREGLEHPGVIRSLGTVLFQVIDEWVANEKPLDMPNFLFYFNIGALP